MQDFLPLKLDTSSRPSKFLWETILVKIVSYELTISSVCFCYIVDSHIYMTYSDTPCSFIAVFAFSLPQLPFIFHSCQCFTDLISIFKEPTFGPSLMCFFSNSLVCSLLVSPFLLILFLQFEELDAWFIFFLIGVFLGTSTCMPSKHCFSCTSHFNGWYFFNTQF